MQYSIRHITKFEYDRSICESVMEVRVCPRTEATQHCYSHVLTVTPHAQLFSYQDFMGNVVHHFDLPGKHDRLELESRALVEVHPVPELPASLPPSAWDELESIVEHEDHLEMTLPSRFTFPSELSTSFAKELSIEKRDDPLSLLRELNSSIYHAFEYSPRSTHANSPIDDALRIRRGVCQDFAHIFITLVRGLGIPCRYVSGYLFHRTGADGDRSAEDGSHAWVEVFLPQLGWVGFDPTNNILAGERHIRAALGRDYADVPPTRGIFSGKARSALHVGVHVQEASFVPRVETMPEMARVVQGENLDYDGLLAAHQQQQQQQQ